MLDTSDHDRAVDLLDAVLGERGAQPLPVGLQRGDQQRARGVDVEAMDDAAAQTSLADPVNSGMPRDHEVENRSRFVLAQRMHRHSGRLVDGEPAGPLRAQPQRQLRRGERALLVAARERRNRQLAAARDARALVALAEPAPVEAHGAAREQPAHLGPRKLELLGQEEIKTPSRVLRVDDERARGKGHGDKVAAH